MKTISILYNPAKKLANQYLEKVASFGGIIGAGIEDYLNPVSSYNAAIGRRAVVEEYERLLDNNELSTLVTGLNYKMGMVLNNAYDGEWRVDRWISMELKTDSDFIRPADNLIGTYLPPKITEGGMRFDGTQYMYNPITTSMNYQNVNNDITISVVFNSDTKASINSFFSDYSQNNELGFFWMYYSPITTRTTMQYKDLTNNTFVQSLISQSMQIKTDNNLIFSERYNDTRYSMTNGIYAKLSTLTFETIFPPKRNIFLCTYSPGHVSMYVGYIKHFYWYKSLFTLEQGTNFYNKLG